jgi:hypothetical protein
MVLGIVTIVLSIPIVSLVLAVVGLSKGRAAKALCDANPGFYSNAGVAQAGVVLCIVSICLNVLSSLCLCGYVSIIGIALMGAAAHHHP